MERLNYIFDSAFFLSFQQDFITLYVRVPASDSCAVKKRDVFLCVLCTVELCACSLTYLCKFTPEPFSKSDLHP